MVYVGPVSRVTSVTSAHQDTSATLSVNVSPTEAHRCEALNDELFGHMTLCVCVCVRSVRLQLCRVGTGGV